MAQPPVRAVLGSVLLCLIAARGGAQSLASRIDAAALRPPFDRAIWAIDVEDAAGNVLYARNPGTLVMPASNRKLFTAAAVSACIGFDRRFATELWIDGDDVVLRGGGDPSLGGRYAFDRDAVFKPLVDALRARGVREVGDVIADASRFDRAVLPPGWEWDDLPYYYAAPVDALGYNENVAGVTVDDCARPVITTDPPFVPATANVTCAEGKEPLVTSDKNNAITIEGEMPPRYQTLGAVGNPALYAAQAFADALRRAGVRVRGTARVNSAPRVWRERVAAVDSPFVAELLAVMLKPSQNLYAETLYKDLSADGGSEASYAASADVERRFLTGEAGLDGAEFRFQDGSGLTTHDLVTAAAVVKLLRWIDAPARRGVWWQLLAAPGEEGTLRRRLLPLAARLRGKTGSIAGVNSLSGIVRGAGGETRYFSIILNHHTAGSGDALRAIDEMAAAIADF